MFGFVYDKNMLIGLLAFRGPWTSMANVCVITTYISFNYQACMIRPTPIDLNPDEHNQGLSYYPLIVNLDGCYGSCNTLDNISCRICVPNKTEDVWFSVFNMITRINESNVLKSPCYANVNVNLIVQNVIQIKSGVNKNVGLSV